MSATPLTDAEASDGWSGDAVCVSADFARKLETELAHWKAVARYNQATSIPSDARMRCEAMVRWIEWGAVIFCAIASVGVTGQYWLAFDFFAFGAWLHLKNNLIAKQRRTLAINKQFWDSAQCDKMPELVATMREFHAKLSSPNVNGEPRHERRS